MRIRELMITEFDTCNNLKPEAILYRLLDQYDCNCPGKIRTRKNKTFPWQFSHLN